MTTLSQIHPSRYTLYHTLADLGFNPLRIATAVEVLMGPEVEIEEEPTDADWDDYARHCEWQDALEAAHPPVREEDIRAAGLAIG